MSMDQPSAADLVEATHEFLGEKIAPELKGFNAFQMRVALNVLKIVERELRLGPDAETRERAGLTTLLGGGEGDIRDLNRQLCTAIREGKLSADTPGLMDHLWQTTLDKVAIDQPKYARYQREAAARNA
ncbi:MAG: DUF6285 domain-containing protein [Alphaproteobacteria bacterium]